MLASAPEPSQAAQASPTPRNASSCAPPRGSEWLLVPIEALDYDIQTTCPEVVEEYELETLRLGDLVAIRDHYDYYGAGRHEGAVTIGVVIDGWSDYAGHGPGLNPVLSALPGRIQPKIDADANVAYYLGIKQKS